MCMTTKLRIFEMLCNIYLFSSSCRQKFIFKIRCSLIFVSLQVLPALRSFCLYCAFGVLIVYILQSVLFTAFLALDIKRVRENRNGFLFCITHKMEEGTDANTEEAAGQGNLFWGIEKLICPTNSLEGP